MKPKTIVALLVVLVVCVGYIVVRHANLFKPNVKEAAPAEAVILPALPGEVTKITVVPADGAKLVLQKSGDEWRIAEPISARADKSLASRIADAIRNLRGAQDDAAGPDVTGLDKPLWTVTLAYDKGGTQTVQVGRPRPLEASRTFVRPEGGHVFLASADLAAELGRPLNDFRSKEVLELIPDDVASVKVAGRENYELTRTDDEWGLTGEGISARADGDKVKQFLMKLGRVVADNFVAEKPADLAAYGLAPGKERLVLTIQMKPEKPKAAAAATAPTSEPAKPSKVYTLAIGGPARDKAFARLGDEPAVFQVKATLVDELQPKIADLRDRKVLSVKPADVVGVELALPTGPVTLAIVDGQWRMEKPFAGKAGADAVMRLLEELAALKAAEFPKDSSMLALYGLDKPTASITLRLSGKDERTTLLIGGRSASNEVTFVKTASGASVAAVPTAEALMLIGEAAGYWDTALLERPADARVTRLDLARLDAPEEEVAMEHGAWALVKPIKAGVDAENIGRAVTALGAVRAGRIVALGASVPEKYATAKDVITAVVTTTTEPASQPASAPTSAPASQSASRPAVTSTVTLKVAKMEGHIYAWVVGQPVTAVGEMTATLYDSLAAEFRDRKLMKLNPDEVETIKITGAETTELHKDKEGWTYPADPYVKLDPEKVKAFLKDVGDLAALRFAAHTGGDGKFGLDKPKVTVDLKLADGQTRQVVVSSTGPTGDFYGTAGGVEGVFILQSAVVDKLNKSLKDFKKTAAPSPGPLSTQRPVVTGSPWD